ncbi:MAG TPA: hypothetical protein VI479_05925 [Blastocatellia bacterium]
MKTHRYLKIFGITFALILGINARVFCQAPQNIPSQVQKVKDQVQKLGIAEDVTVILLNGEEFYGAISRIESDSFEITEVDLKQKMAFDYKDVKKARKGYGGRGFGGKRVNPRVNLIAGIAVIVGLISLAVIFAPRT